MRIRRRTHEAELDEPEAPPESVLAQRVLAHAASPEEKLELLLADRSRQLEEQAARFDRALEDIERRETLLRDMRVSVERMLRLGSTDLGERESELERLDRDIAERRARLSEDEAELERRRSELGAVELKREAVEQKERALVAREEELGAKEAEQLTELESTGRGREVAGADVDAEQTVTLVFIPGTAYSLVEVEATEVQRGATLEVRGESYVVTRIGGAPLPGDKRRCAYVERVPPGSSSGSSEDGSS